MEQPMEHLSYRVIIDPLPAEDGGGYLAMVPDLPGCMSDGETPQEAASNVEGAVTEWIHEAGRLNRPIPAPTRYMTS
jgi:antitoxin HicB